MAGMLTGTCAIGTGNRCACKLCVADIACCFCSAVTFGAMNGGGVAVFMGAVLKFRGGGVAARLAANALAALPAGAWPVKPAGGILAVFSRSWRSSTRA